VFIKSEEEKTRSIVLSPPYLFNVIVSGGNSRERLCSSWRDRSNWEARWGVTLGPPQLGWWMLKSPSRAWLAEASEIAAETKEKISWVPSERGSLGGWFSEEVG
jgi:hypothetical protein